MPMFDMLEAMKFQAQREDAARQEALARMGLSQHESQFTRSHTEQTRQFDINQQLEQQRLQRLKDLNDQQRQEWEIANIAGGILQPNSGTQPTSTPTSPTDVQSLMSPISGLTPRAIPQATPPPGPETLYQSPIGSMIPMGTPGTINPDFAPNAGQGPTIAAAQGIPNPPTGPPPGPAGYPTTFNNHPYNIIPPSIRANEALAREIFKAHEVKKAQLQEEQTSRKTLADSYLSFNKAAGMDSDVDAARNYFGILTNHNLKDDNLDQIIAKGVNTMFSSKDPATRAEAKSMTDAAVRYKSIMNAAAYQGRMTTPNWGQTQEQHAQALGQNIYSQALAAIQTKYPRGNIAGDPAIRKDLLNKIEEIAQHYDAGAKTLEDKATLARARKYATAQHGDLERTGKPSLMDTLMSTTPNQ